MLALKADYLIQYWNFIRTVQGLPTVKRQMSHLPAKSKDIFKYLPVLKALYIPNVHGIEILK